MIAKPGLKLVICDLHDNWLSWKPSTMFNFYWNHINDWFTGVKNRLLYTKNGKCEGNDNNIDRAGKLDSFYGL